jgi:AcrR family transcriptional regulator/DNA-binding MarR family transcriptional regulator
MGSARDRGRAGASSRRRPGHDVAGRGSSRSPREYGREQVVEIQRARMLAAMVEVCGERGVGNVTVAHVVARAGISRRTFYESFEDREDCFLATFDHALDRAAAVVVPAYESRGAWRERIRAGLAALLGFLEDEPGLGALLVVDALGAGPRALERRAHVLDALIAAVAGGGAANGRGKESPTPLTAEGVVGAVFGVIHARLLERRTGARAANGRSADGRSADGAGALDGLLNPLMSLIVVPYLGASASRRELDRPLPELREPRLSRANPLRELDMRLTYRTVRVLLAIAERPGASNRRVGEDAEVQDQGQISKLLTRLHKLGLIENTGAGHAKGAPNEWMLTTKGRDVQREIATQSAR